MIKAIFEETGHEMDAAYAKRLFHHLYEYLLYNDTPFFQAVLDYRMNLDPLDRAREGYLLFRFMLHLMRESHPSRLSCLMGGLPIAT